MVTACGPYTGTLVAVYGNPCSRIRESYARRIRESRTSRRLPFDLVTYNTAGTQAITSDYIASGPTARCVFTPPFWTLSLGRLGTSCRLTPEWRNAVTSVLPCGYATPPRLIDARSTVYNAFNCYIPFLCHTAASSRLFFATAQLPHGRFADAATANVRSGHIAEIHFGMIAFAH